MPAAASPWFSMRRVPMALGACAVALLAACASAPGDRRPLVSVSLPSSASMNEAARLRWLDRVGWGASASSEAQLAQRGLAHVDAALGTAQHAIGDVRRHDLRTE